MRRRTAAMLKAVVSVLLLVLLFTKYDGVKALVGLGAIPLLIWGGIVVIVVLSILLNAARFWLLVRCIRKISYKNTVLPVLLSWSIGLATPGKVGQFSLAWFMGKNGIRIGESMAAVLVDKVISIFSLLVLGALSVFAFFPIEGATLVIAMTLGMCVAFSVLLVSPRGRGLVRRLLGRHAIMFEGFARTSQVLLARKGVWGLAFVVSLVAWIVNSTAVYLFMIALGADVTFVQTVSIKAVLMLVSFIPITLAGLGLREGMAILLFAQLGVDEGLTLSAFIGMFIVNYTFAVLVFLLWRPYFTKKASNAS